MEEILGCLKDPFKGLKPDDVTGIQARCTTIAERLFGSYGIKCGDKTLRFAEIEFYYYKNEASCTHNWNAPWNRETYPRNKNAADFFFHYSGVDLCFQCRFDERERDDEYGEFGGILIRSLVDGDRIIAGPLFCANTMLNACGNQMPFLVPVDVQPCTYEKCLRCGIDSDKSQEGGKELKLCYYVTSIHDRVLQWDQTSKRVEWNKSKGIFRYKSRNYKRERGF